MKSFLRSIVCAGGGLLLLVAAYCVAQVAGFRVLADMSKAPAVEQLVGAVDAAVGTPPASAKPRPRTWGESAKTALALWGPFVPLALTVAVVVYLARVAWRLRHDIGLLRDGVRSLGSRTPKMALDEFAYEEVRECADELSRLVGTLRVEKGRLSEDAFRDPLTGLPNRRALMETLTREVAGARRTGWPLCYIMVDLDHFKILNDTYGHQAGDLVLKRAGERMASLVRQMDLIARFGGEEFAIILPNANLAQGMEIAWQLCNALRSDLVMMGEQSIKVSASFGVAELRECRVSDPDGLARCADRALYEAKENGRNTVVAAQPAGAPHDADDGDGQPQGETPTGQRTPADLRATRMEPEPIDADTMALMGSTFSILQLIPDRHRVAHDILQQVAATLACQDLSLFLRDPEQDQLECVACLGRRDWESSTETAATDDVSEWFFGPCASGSACGGAGERRVQILRVTNSSPDAGTTLARVPLAVQDDLLGVIEIADFGEEVTTTPRQESLLSAVCLIGATALHLCDRFHREEARWIGLIEPLCRIIHDDKPFKRDHAMRVCSLSAGIASQLGQTQENELQLLRIAALVKDIGENNVPRRIREKKSRLRDGEWKLVQEHVKIGADMIDEVGSMSRLARIVLHHHEHYDGKGYPDALEGEQIPLESRILSVADAFVAMTSERPYRSKLPEAIAMQRIMAASGDQFDPVVVNAFMQNASAEAMAEYESRQPAEERVPSCSA